MNFGLRPGFGAQPQIRCAKIDGSAERFRTSGGIAESRCLNFLGKAVWREQIYPVATALGTETTGLLRRKPRLRIPEAQRRRTNQTHVRRVLYADQGRRRLRREEGAI